jgi:hypothetical protein
LTTPAAKPLRNHVAGNGAAAMLKARVWEEFTARTVAALREAMTVLAQHGIGFDHETKRGYWGGGKRSVKGTRVLLPRENAITDALTRALEVVRQDASPDDLLRKRQICFPPQQPRSRQSRLGSDALTTDIQARSLETSYLDLRIEAKVLFGSGDVIHYCGDKGLLRFANAEPYTEQPVGMMIGYSVRHDEAHWANRIQAKASGSPEVRSFQHVTLETEEILSSTLTSHASGEVLVLHLVLPFETKPSARALDALS